MRITKISVKGLFGMFDHEIPLNQESRITIVHGPNGVGKTVLLRMVHGLFSGDFEIFSETPFGQFHVEFEPGESFAVKKLSVQNSLQLEYQNGGEILNEVFVLSRRPPYQNQDRLRRSSSQNTSISDIPYGLATSFLYRLLPTAARFFLLPYPHLEIKEVLGRYERSDPVAVEKLPDRFRRILAVTNPELIQVGRLWSRVLDTYRWLEASSGRSSGEVYEQGVQRSAEDIRPSRLAALKQRILRLFSRPGKGRKRKQNGKSVTRNQNIQKFYESTLNELLLYKSLKTDRSVLFRSDEAIRITGHSGNAIPMECLSSGEQHLVIMFQKLLQAERGTLVMIDEPELSLHVVWQRRFLELVEQITRDRDIDVIVATHSPQIISDNWDWMVALGDFEGDYDEETA